MAQYSIPQFIEEEGRIVFFLTFRQFFILVGGGAVCFLFYFTGLPLIWFLIFAILIMASAVAIAFVKIDNVTIPKMVLNFFGFYFGSKVYTWQKGEVPHDSFRQELIKKSPLKNSALNKTKREIETAK